jgi:hypothetical protein
MDTSWLRAGALSLVLVACGDDSMPPGGGDGSGGGGDGPSGQADARPPGGAAIAGEYPGDVGIGGDPRVLFADDFESYASGADLDSRWDAVYHMAAIATEPAHVYAGGKSLQFTAPAQDVELSNGVAKVLAEEQDVVYLRYYSKYESSFDITGSSHNGGDISAHYFVDGNATPGIPADGTNKYLISYENWRGEPSTMTPGDLNIYIYHPEQRDVYGDHFFPNGDVMPNTSIPGNFGPEFVPRPNLIPELGRWYAYEVMLKANTPGERDGRVTCWVDGEVIADFTNLRLRDIPTLTIDRVGLSLHFRSNPTETRKWYDNVVVATEYIGPMVPAP